MKLYSRHIYYKSYQQPVDYSDYCVIYAQHSGNKEMIKMSPRKFKWDF